MSIDLPKEVWSRFTKPKPGICKQRTMPLVFNAFRVHLEMIWET